jgi:hypothetical protein
MLTQADIARDWNCSRAYINQLIKRGLPLDSFENARLWRDAHARRRAPTDPKQLARLEERPTEPQGSTHATVKPSESMEDTLRNACRAADEAWRLLNEAMLEGKVSKISVLLSIHNKAIEGRIRAETMIREEKERRNILIPLAKAQEITRNAFEVVIKRLNALPQNIAPRCNPHDPAHALGILEDECIGIISAAQKAIA